MKRKNFIKEIIKKGCFLRRHGTRHDIYENTNNGKIAPIPRHIEIKESLCRIILKTIRFIRNQAVIPKPSVVNHIPSFAVNISKERFRGFLREAEKLVEETGCHRREREVAELREWAEKAGDSTFC